MKRAIWVPCGLRDSHHGLSELPLSTKESPLATFRPGTELESIPLSTIAILVYVARGSSRCYCRICCCSVLHLTKFCSCVTVKAVLKRRKSQPRSWNESVVLTDCRVIFNTFLLTVSRINFLWASANSSARCVSADLILDQLEGSAHDGAEITNSLAICSAVISEFCGAKSTLDLIFTQNVGSLSCWVVELTLNGLHLLQSDGFADVIL